MADWRVTSHTGAERAVIATDVLFKEHFVIFHHAANGVVLAIPASHVAEIVKLTPDGTTPYGEWK